MPANLRMSPSQLVYSVECVCVPRAKEHATEHLLFMSGRTSSLTALPVIQEGRSVSESNMTTSLHLVVAQLRWTSEKNNVFSMILYFYTVHTSLCLKMNSKS